MAELTPKERLQPALLERLTDDEPDKNQESRDKRIVSLGRLRECVRRDMAWLLNTTDLASVEPLDDYPEVARSVVNYGLPDLTGRTASGINVPALERMLREAIWEFEPRLLRDTVQVHLLLDESRMDHNALTFEIKAELWAQPVPLESLLRTEVDFESGEARISDQGRAA